MSTLEKRAEQLLKNACRQLASDIHFYPNKQNVIIYFRIHGKRSIHRKIHPSFYKQLLAYFKFTSGMDIGEVQKPQNGTFTFTYNEINYAVRLSTLPLQHSESLALRLLPMEDHLTLQHLFLFPYQFEQMKRILSYKDGLILLTGPTGSGKTTTLYALLETLAQTNAYQAITLEDPIEKQIDNIIQVQINEKSGVTYDIGLKAVLRHDPDIIMVGEIREANIAKFAHRAALTGHLVLSTLHAKDSVSTIERLLEMGLSKTDIAQTLIFIIALRLVPIKVNGQTLRRAAIFEMLQEKEIQHILAGQPLEDLSYQTFTHLRKKAYAYGFIDEETLK